MQTLSFGRSDGIVAATRNLQSFEVGDRHERIAEAALFAVGAVGGGTDRHDMREATNRRPNSNSSEFKLPVASATATGAQSLAAENPDSCKKLRFN